MDKMPYIEVPLHGKYSNGCVALVDADYDGEYFSQFKWYVSSKGYAVRLDYTCDTGRKLVYMHHEVLPGKTKAGHFVRDHIDGNKLNNRSCNLRFVSHSNNIKNTLPRSTTGYKGVYKRNDRNTKPYQVKRNQKHIGYYSALKDAAIAYNDVAKSDDFARLNIL